MKLGQPRVQSRSCQVRLETTPLRRAHGGSLLAGWFDRRALREGRVVGAVWRRAWRDLAHVAVTTRVAQPRLGIGIVWVCMWMWFT